MMRDYCEGWLNTMIGKVYAFYGNMSYLHKFILNIIKVPNDFVPISLSCHVSNSGLSKKFVPLYYICNIYFKTTFK